MGVRRCKKEDLRRIAAATGGTLLPNLADLAGEEAFDPVCLGQAEEVSEEKVGDGTLFFRAWAAPLYPSSPFQSLSFRDIVLHPAFVIVVSVFFSHLA